MTRLVVCALALLAASGLADPVPRAQIADPVLLQRQVDLISLYFHPHEPNHIPEQKTIAAQWSIEKNIEKYSNVTAVKQLVELLEYGVLPMGVPFSILEPNMKYESVVVFNVLYSAKDYTTFYNTAVYLRDHLNEGLYLYVLSAVILHRQDTQGIVIPPIYEVFPSYFFNGEIMTTAQRINTHGSAHIENYPSTYLWNENVVIMWNETVWPYTSPENVLAYFTNDYRLNAFYFYNHLLYPSWLGGDVVTLNNDRRGEWWWFIHKQIMSRYYMERLSNGLGEIPEAGLPIVEQGYTPGLMYHNGISYPVRPNYFSLEQPEFIDELLEIKAYERRIRDAIESGYIINTLGEKISIRKPEAINVLANLIESNIDSVNSQYYKDFISIWKSLLGNSVVHEHNYYHKHYPLIVPSVLEHYQTALRDPAYYMIWKRVLNLFTLWQEQLPLYKREELALPSVQIQKVEVDKLVTYFEQTYVNISNHLYMSEKERHQGWDDVSVLVQKPQLNHKVFKVNINVKSDVAKPVLVKLFLAPKYDSHGYEIPLSINSQNFFEIDEFRYDLPAGESVIQRLSSDNPYLSSSWESGVNVYEKAVNALHGKGQLILDMSQSIAKWPQQLLLPKGRVGGMPFVMMVYITEYRPPKVPYGTGFNPAISLGLGSGARRMSGYPLGFPLDRPMHQWQIEGLHNIVLQDVLIYHKPTPEIVVPHTV